MKTNHSPAASRPSSTAHIARLVAAVLLFFCATDALQLFEDDVRVSKRRTGPLGGSLTVDSTPISSNPVSVIVKDSGSNVLRQLPVDSLNPDSVRSAFKADTATRVPKDDKSMYVKTYLELVAAVAASSGLRSTIVIDSSFTLLGNVTTHDSTIVQFTSSGRINTGSYILTINGELSDCTHQIFVSDSAHTPIVNSAWYIRPEWFGAKVSRGITGSTYTTAVNRAARCAFYSKGVPVFFRSGVYKVSGQLITCVPFIGMDKGDIVTSDLYGSSQYNDTSMVLLGKTGSTLYWDSLTLDSSDTYVVPDAGILAADGNAINSAYFKDLKFLSCSQGGNGGGYLLEIGVINNHCFANQFTLTGCQVGNFKGVYWSAISSNYMRDCKFRGCLTFRIGQDSVNGCTAGRIINCQFEGCGREGVPFFYIKEAMSLDFMHCVMQGTTWIMIHRMTGPLVFNDLWYEHQRPAPYNSQYFIRMEGRPDDRIQNMLFYNCNTGAGTAGDISIAESPLADGGSVNVYESRIYDSHIWCNSGQRITTYGNASIGPIHGTDRLTRYSTSLFSIPDLPAYIGTTDSGGFGFIRYADYTALQMFRKDRRIFLCGGDWPSSVNGSNIELRGYDYDDGSTQHDPDLILTAGAGGSVIVNNNNSGSLKLRQGGLRVLSNYDTSNYVFIDSNIIGHAGNSGVGTSMRYWISGGLGISRSLDNSIEMRRRAYNDGGPDSIFGIKISPAVDRWIDINVTERSGITVRGLPTAVLTNYVYIQDTDTMKLMSMSNLAHNIGKVDSALMADSAKYLRGLSTSITTKKIVVGVAPDTGVLDSSGLTLFNGATEWRDQQVDASKLKTTGADIPEDVEWTKGSFSGSVLTFQQGDKATSKCQFNHDRKSNSDVYAHIHWTPHTRGNEEANATVNWVIGYSWASIGSVFPNYDTLWLNDTCTGNDNDHLMTRDILISGAGKGFSSILDCFVLRATGDTWSGATNAQSPGFLSLDFHYEVDKLGSNNHSSD